MLLKQQRQLIDTGLVSQKQMTEAMQSKEGEKSGILMALLSLNGIEGDRVLNALAKIYKVPYLDINNIEIDENLIKKCPEDLCSEFHFVPIGMSSGEIVIATADPMDYAGMDVLQFKLGQRVRPVFASPELIQQKIRDVFSDGEAAFDAAMDGLDDAASGFETSHDDEDEDDDSNLDALKKGAEGSPIIKLVNGIILKAMQMGSSDIHIEAGENSSVVRLRVDGRLRAVMQFPTKAHPMLVSRIKIMSKLDISNTRTPQDGRARVKFMDKSFDMRISTLPALHGEKVVMRILDKSGLSLSLDILAFEKKADERIREAIARPTGAVLVTGPTGSGKTTTLYSFLHHINDEETNIVTVEDPVEFQIKGLNQVQVNPKAGLTFAAALRSILRQDPDVVMVGEIRDEETAHIALHAAQTGHLVMSTLHTNDAPSTVSRLVEMGTDAVALSSCLNIIVAQRLARRLCKCKKKINPTPEMIALYDMPPDLEIYEPVGCDKCMDVGYKGRCGVHETLYVNDRVREAIAGSVSDQELMQTCREEGMYCLFEDGMNKVLQGITSVKEVTRLAIPPEDFTFRDRIDEGGLLMSLGQAMEARSAGQVKVSDEGAAANTILIIDDSKSIRSLVRFVLQAEGHDIVEAEDGMKGLSLLKKATDSISMVLVDYEMPNMTGPEFIAEARRQSKYDDIPIVMLTSRKDEDDEVLGLESGADDYITKPVEPMKLQARVRKTLSMYRRIRKSHSDGVQ